MDHEKKSLAHRFVGYRLHICIGSVYAWSVLTKPIMEAMGFSCRKRRWTFSLAYFIPWACRPVSWAVSFKKSDSQIGSLVDDFLRIGHVRYGSSLYLHSLPMLYLFYGVIGGIGLGTGYITPVSTLVKWFPENRGFATGLAIMGFGFASLIAGPAMQILVQSFGLVANFIILGIVYMVIMTASSLYLAPPEEDSQRLLKEIER